MSVLDIGAGSGLLAMMAARAGAEKVVACEWHGALATCARRNVAANGLSRAVTVASGDVAKLRREGVPVDGFDVAVVDLFDAGLTGDHVLWMLEQARKNVLAPDAVVVPAAATMYCVGLEAYTAEVNGFDFSAFNKYRWDSTYRATKLADETDVRVLTKPKRVFEFFLQRRERDANGEKSAFAAAPTRETVARLETVASGYLNAVAFWFDLHMDEKETITTAPRGYGKGGTVLFEETRFRNDPDGLRAAREAGDLAAKREMKPPPRGTPRRSRQTRARTSARRRFRAPKTRLETEATRRRNAPKTLDARATRSRRRSRREMTRARLFPRARLRLPLTTRAHLAETTRSRRRLVIRGAPSGTPTPSGGSTTGAKPCSTSSAACRCARTRRSRCWLGARLTACGSL